MSNAQQITSVRQLAREVGRSRTAVTKWLKRRDFPASRTGPWSAAEVQAIREWMATLQPDRGNPGAQVASAAPTDPASKDHWLARKYRSQRSRMRLA